MACRLLKRDRGGILHIHQNVSSPVSCTDVKLQPTSPAVDEEQGEITSTAEEQVSPKGPRGSNRDRDAWRTWAENTASRIAELLRDLVGGLWKINIKHIEHVKSYAPHIHHIVLDLECRPL